MFNHNTYRSKGIVRAITPRLVDAEVIARGSPFVKVALVAFEAKIGRQGMFFHRQ